MLRAFLNARDKLAAKYRDYARDLSNYIESSLDKELPLYAVHGHCTDGGTAGSLIRYAIPEAVIVPLDYWLLNDKFARPILSALNWTGIVDLEPFNEKKVDFWVDHHLSAIGKTVSAKRIRFDVDGDSGTWQLLLSSFISELPDHLVELAVMTRTTDTANYLTSPPTNLINDLTDLDITVFEGEEGRKQEEQRIWLLDDAWGSVFSLKEHLQMFNYLAIDGFYGLSNVLNRINEHRKKRIKAIEIVEEIDTSFDIVAFIFEENTVDKFTILRKLQEKGVKVVISLSKSQTGVTLSLRRNRLLSTEVANNIKLNELATSMKGGGHAGAAGAHTNTVEEAINIINKWSKLRDLSLNFQEI